MTPADVLESGVRHVIIATGSTWRRDGIGRALWKPVPGHDLPTVYTPDDLMSGTLPAGRVLIYDDDHYYMGGALAELLIQQGCMVTLATPAALASAWTAYTLEQEKIEKKLVEMGVTILTRRTLKAIRPGGATLSDSISGSESDLPCDAVVLVTDRLPEDGLYRALKPALAEGRLDSLRVIGDAEAPNLIVRAVFSGYRAAAEFGEVVGDEVSFRVERVGK
jgi:dimethylamine/trimethylamine dehydrogenase